MDLTPFSPAAVIAALTPTIGPFVKRVFDPPTEALGEWLKTFITRESQLSDLKGFVRRVEVIKKAQQILTDAGLDVRRIGEKIGIPLLEAVSLEEEPSLQEKWAALLANAANASGPELHHAFPRILANLSAKEAKFLDILFDAASRRITIRVNVTPSSVAGHSACDQNTISVMCGDVGFRWSGNDERDFIIDHLVGEGLLRAATDFDIPPAPPTPNVSGYKIPRFRMTVMGAEFVTACRAPRGVEKV